MKLLTIDQDGKDRPAVWNEKTNRVCSLDSLGFSYRDMLDVIRDEDEGKLAKIEQKLSQAADSQGKLLENVTKKAPIPVPAQDMICLGINYMAHAEESARYKKEAFGGDRPYAVYFSKRINEAVPDGDYIDSHSDLVERLDYEAELAVIIGRDAKDVKKEDARDYIFGYTIINDVSAREVQIRHKQWYFGKGMDSFTPMGPWIVTREEIMYPPKLEIKSYVNQELRQDSNTSLLIFDIDHVIAELSRGMTLKAGTIIATGTPSGVGMGFEPPKFLKPGDEVVCEIEGIGRITNTVK